MVLSPSVRVNVTGNFWLPLGGELQLRLHLLFFLEF